MNRLILVALLLLKAGAFADPAGLVHVKKGTEPAWLSVTATAEQNRATYVIRVNKDKGIDVDKHRFALRFQVPEYEYPAFLIPVELHQDKTGLDATFIVPVEVARKGSLYLGVESREVKNGQASYLISMSSYTMSSYTSPLEYIEKTGKLELEPNFEIVPVPEFRVKQSDESREAYAQARVAFYLRRITQHKGEYFPNVSSIVRSEGAVAALIELLGSPDKDAASRALALLNELHHALGRPNPPQVPKSLEDWRAWFKVTGSRLAPNELWANFDSHYQ